MSDFPTQLSEQQVLNEAFDQSTNSLRTSSTGGGSSGTQYAEGVTTSPATGNAFLGRYVATPPGTSADGSLHVPLLDNFNQLKVVPVGSVASGAASLTPSTLQNAATALGNGTLFSISGMAEVRLTVTVTGTATITMEGTEDGTTYFPISAEQSNSTPSSTITASCMAALHVVGLQTIRARISSYSSGSVTVTAHASPNSAPPFLPKDSSGRIVVASGNPTTPVNGQATVGTSAAALASNSLTNGVIVQALSTNTVSIFVGVSGVTTSTGFELQPGQATSVAVTNTSSIFAISGSAAQGLCFIGS